MTRHCIAAIVSTVWLAQGSPPTRSGVVTGRVVDEFGDPVINARVVAEAPPFGNAAPAATDRAAPSTAPGPRTLAATSTDDRGADMTDRPIAFGRRDQSLSDVEVVLTDRISRLDGAGSRW